MADYNHHTFENEASYKWMCGGITALFISLAHGIYNSSIKKKKEESNIARWNKPEVCFPYSVLTLNTIWFYFIWLLVLPQFLIIHLLYLLNYFLWFINTAPKLNNRVFKKLLRDLLQSCIVFSLGFHTNGTLWLLTLALHLLPFISFQESCWNWSWILHFF